MRAGLLAAALSLLAPALMPAQDRDVLLRGEFPVDYMVPPSPEGFQGLSAPDFIPRFPDSDSAKAVRAEAVWVFSGMIWGFDYLYTPSDKVRNVEELFTITPRGTIQPGDPALRVESVRVEGMVILATVTYLPAIAARHEYFSWSGSLFTSAQGRGGASALPPIGQLSPAGRVESRQAAIAAATREALRDCLRGQTHNKPREVRGSCSFAAQPYVSVISGSYAARVRLRVAVSEIIPYGKY